MKLTTRAILAAFGILGAFGALALVRYVRGVIQITEAWSRQFARGIPR